MFKVKNRNIRASCKIWSKLAIKKPVWRHWRNFEHISYLFLVFGLSALSRYMRAGICWSHMESWKVYLLLVEIFRYSYNYTVWTFPLRIYSVNVTKSAGNCGLITFTEESWNGKVYFLCSVIGAKFKFKKILSIFKMLLISIETKKITTYNNLL